MTTFITRFARFACVPLFVIATAVQGSQPAYAASGYTLFGDASLTTGHNSSTGVQLRSVGAGFGGIDFAVPTGTTFAELNTLSADFFAVAGGCGGGSPRFQINFGSQNIFVYLGTPPNYDCVTGTWLSSGDLLSSGKTVDTTQLGGTFYDPYDHAVATYGNLTVTGIQLVVDAGWKFGTQTIIVDNVVINGTTYTFESPTASSCKNGGWMSFTSAPGPFKNQGDCVSYFATNGRNTAQ